MAIFVSTLAFMLLLQFYRLGELPIVQWDESRLAVNAAEMSRNGLSLLTTFEDVPDLYNTKPPLMIWLQTCSIYLFGISEFAIRLPSALAGLACMLFAVYAAYRFTGNLLAASLCGLLLAGSDGFIQLHGSLTGDYDALLCALLLPAVYHHYRYLYLDAQLSKRYFVIWMALAIMSKSAAAIITFPLFTLSAVLHRPKEKLPATLAALLLSCLPFALFCITREYMAPGYLKAILQNDFLGRYTTVIEGHYSKWHYYIVNLFTYRYSLFICLLPPALIFAIAGKNKEGRYWSVFILGYLTLLSAAGTRIHWYDMPVLPMISILLAWFINTLYGLAKQPVYRIMMLVFIGFGLLPVLRDKTLFCLEHKGMKLDMGHLELSRMLRKHQGPQRAKYLAGPYDAEFYFYTLSNPYISRGRFQDIRAGDTVLFGNLYKDSILQNFSYTISDSTSNAFKTIIRATENR